MSAGWGIELWYNVKCELNVNVKIMKKYIFIIIALWISFFLVKVCISVAKPIHGQIIDSVTKKPLPNIIVTRVVNVKAASIGDSVSVPYIVYAIRSDSNGYFSVNRNIEITGISISPNDYYFVQWQSEDVAGA